MPSGWQDGSPDEIIDAIFRRMMVDENLDRIQSKALRVFQAETDEQNAIYGWFGMPDEYRLLDRIHIGEYPEET